MASFVFLSNRRHDKPSSKQRRFPTALDIYEIDNDHANIMNDVKVSYAEQEISFKKLEKRNVSFSYFNYFFNHYNVLCLLLLHRMS